MIKYTIELEHVPRSPGWFVRVVELPGCISQGDTIGKALVNIREAMELWLGVALDDGDPPPVPDCYACKVCLRPIEETIEGELICSECRDVRDLDADAMACDEAIAFYQAEMQDDRCPDCGEPSDVVWQKNKLAFRCPRCGVWYPETVDGNELSKNVLDQDNSRTTPDLQMVEGPVSVLDYRHRELLDLLKRLRSWYERTPIRKMNATEDATEERFPAAALCRAIIFMGRVVRGEANACSATEIDSQPKPLAELKHLNVLCALEKAHGWAVRAPIAELEAIEDALEERFPMESILTAIEILKAE